MKISTYRKLGRQSLAGNWTYGVLLCLLASIIAGLIGSLTGGFGTIIAGLIAAGVDIAFYNSLMAIKSPTTLQHCFPVLHLND